jgi:hypothetical protein
MSDRLESEPDYSPIVQALEARALQVIGRGWNKRLPASLLTDVGQHRRYNYNSVRDCLRMIRNKRNHFHELPRDVRTEVLGGDDPRLLVPFMLHPDRFPHLLMACYDVCVAFFADVGVFARFLGPHTVRMHTRSAAANRCRADAETAAVRAASSSTPTTVPEADAGVAAVDGASVAPAGVGASPAVAGGVAAAASPAPRSVTASYGATPLAPITVFEAEERVRSQYCPPVSSQGWYLPADAWLSLGSLMAERASALQVAVLDVSGVAAASGDADTADDADAGATPTTAAARGRLVCAVGNVRETSFKGGARIHDARYKTAECMDWKLSGGESCPRGVRCDFAHGPIEMRLRRARWRR